MFLSDPTETSFTFGAPGGNDPFSFTLHDAFKIDGKALEGLQTGAAPTDDEIRKADEIMSRGFWAAERQTRLVDTINGRQNALAEAADNRIATIRQQTGVELENPFRGGYANEARERIGGRLDAAGGLDESELPVAQRDIFNEKVDELAQNFPDKAAALNFGQSFEDQARAIAASAEQGNKEGEGGFLAQLAGGMWGSRRDPLFVGSLLIGPGLSQASTALARVAYGALKQGLYNAGLQLAAQPAVQAWRAEIGEKSGVVPALETVGLAFLSGAIPGAGIEGVRALSRPAKQSLERIATGAPHTGDVEAVAHGLGLKLDDDAARMVKTAEADMASDAEAIGGRPPGVPAQEHADISAQAIRHAEDPAREPPPEIPVIVPSRRRDHARVLDEDAPAAIGDREMVDGKPVTFGRFDPGDLQADAATFQYKGGGDAAGVTERLKNVTRWDPLASGKTLIWERADGAQFVADGHQRLGLAKRLSADDANGIKLDGFRFREVDGWSPADVRAIAAKKNMQEGSGDALDAARVLRDRPDLLDGSLPITSPMMKGAIALSRLSDEAFGMALNGVVPPNYAAAVGSMVADKLQHAAVLSDLVRFKPETEREARLLIGEIMSAGFRAEEQINLFGAAEATRSLMGERVRVLDSALAGLTKDKRLFGTLAEKADAIEAAGNQLARGTNKARARDAAALGDMLTRLAQRTGPVSDALNRAAARVAEGVKTGRAADGFLDEVRALLDRDGLAGLLASPELKPRLIIEPGTPDALAAAETANAARLEPANPEPRQSHPGAFQTFIGGQRGITVEDLARRATALQAEIGTIGRSAASASGALFVDPGPKRIERLAEKIRRKGYDDASQITDAARGGLIVDTPAQADAAVAALERQFDILDEGWKTSNAGYVDRKLLVRGADGTIGEIQIIPSAMFEAKKGGGQALYKVERSLPFGEEKEAAVQRQRDLYSAAAGKLGADWEGIAATSSGPNSGSNVLRHEASDITAALSETSEPSTSFQVSPGLSMANARTPGSNTAGRHSQLQNVRAMDENVRPAASENKAAEPDLFNSMAVASREDGRDVRFISRDQALAEADKPTEHADIVASCKG